MAVRNIAENANVRCYTEVGSQGALTFLTLRNERSRTSITDVIGKATIAVGNVACNTGIIHKAESAQATLAAVSNVANIASRN